MIVTKINLGNDRVSGKTAVPPVESGATYTSFCPSDRDLAKYCRLNFAHLSKQLICLRVEFDQVGHLGSCGDQLPSKVFAAAGQVAQLPGHYRELVLATEVAYVRLAIDRHDAEPLVGEPCEVPEVTVQCGGTDQQVPGLPAVAFYEPLSEQRCGLGIGPGHGIESRIVVVRVAV